MKLFFSILFTVVGQISHSQNLSMPGEFVKLQCGLFRNVSGDIGLKGSCLLDDLGGKTICYTTSVYLIGQNDGAVELKSIVDTATFQILSDYYCKDKRYVYALFYTSSGITINVNRKIVAQAFVTYGSSSYGTDGTHVYFRADVVKKVDRDTFVVFAADEFGAFDKNNFYNYGEILSDDEARKRGFFRFEEGDQNIKGK